MEFERFINNKEVEMKSPNTEATIRSLEVVRLINKFREKESKSAKRHNTFMRDIRNELRALEKAGVSTEEYFIESTYKDKQGKIRPCYILTLKGIGYLRNISKYDIKAYLYISDKMSGNKTNIEMLPATSTRKELLIKQVLLALFNEEQIYEQYPVLNYRLDYYIPDCDLIIEYDEISAHKNKKKDDERMNEILDYLIEQWLNNPKSDAFDVDNYINKKRSPSDIFTVIRIKEFEENKGLTELFEFIADLGRSYTKIKNF